jgi:hypothetical protein
MCLAASCLRIAAGARSTVAMLIPTNANADGLWDNNSAERLLPYHGKPEMILALWGRDAKHKTGLRGEGEPISFDRLLANFARSVGTTRNAAKCSFDLLEQFR